jgi:uncharacterized protein (DUF2249 family)
MKVRSGFVSNSSSTSFIVIIPPDFNAKVAVDKVPKSRREFVMDMLTKLQSGEHVYEDLYDDHEKNDVYPAAYEDLVKILKKYTVADKRSGPDDGEIVPVDVAKARRILEGTFNIKWDEK